MTKTVEIAVIRASWFVITSVSPDYTRYEANMHKYQLTGSSYAQSLTSVTLTMEESNHFVA